MLKDLFILSDVVVCVCVCVNQVHFQDIQH